MLKELTKRRILKTLVIYVGVAWLITEIILVASDRLGAPAWIGDTAVIIFIAGFPLATLFAWMYDVEDGRVRRVATGRKSLMALVLAGATMVSAGAAIVFYIQHKPTAVAESAAQAVKTGLPAVALFPFDDLSSNDRNSFIGRTISGDIVQRLNKINGLRTKSLPYVEALLHRGLDEVQITEKLNASHMLQGSIRTENEQVVLNVQLVDARNGDIAWSADYHDDMSNLLGMQQAITDNVAISVGAFGQEDTSDDIRNVHPEAYMLYADSQRLANEFKFDEAIRALTEATRLDPEFVEGFVALAYGYVVRAWAIEDRFGPFNAAAEQYALRALELDPESVDAKLALAQIHVNQYEWIKGREILDTIPEAFRSTHEFVPPIVASLGHLQEAVDVSKTLYEENPYGNGLGFLTVYYSAAEQFDSALQAAELARIEDVTYDVSRIGLYHAKNGNIDLATEMFEQYFQFWGFDPALAPDYARSIDAGAAVGKFKAALVSPAQQGAHFDANTIFFYVAIGYPEEIVFDLADRLYDAKRLNVIALYGPYTGKYRSHPRFNVLMERVGLLDYWRKYNPPDFCQFKEADLYCR